MGIYITGDIHGNPSRFSSGIFYEQKEFSADITKNTIIQLGDFGLIWSSKETKEEAYKLNLLSNKPFTVAFIDGNHDNISRLDSFPIKEWNGGLVNEIRPNVVRLRRGEVYSIEGKKFFAFGGASSHDIQDGIIDGNDPKWKEKARKMDKEGKYMFRIKGLSWWEEELPTKEEMENGIKNLEKNQYKVDFILSHSPSASVIALLGKGLYQQDHLTRYLEEIRVKTEFKKWFMGHMHIDYALNDKDILLYEQIVRIN